MVVATSSQFDVDRLPNLSRIAHHGAVGLASNRTLGTNTTENGALTIGAGNLAKSFSPGIIAYNEDEPVHGLHRPAGQIYETLTGLKADPSGCVLLSLPAIKAGMAKESTNTKLGSLGETLRVHGFKVCSWATVIPIYSRCQIPPLGCHCYGRLGSGPPGKHI